MFVRHIFDYDVIYSTEKCLPHKMLLVQYLKNAFSSINFSNKLKQYLRDKWSTLESDFHKLSLCTVQNSFVCGNQLLLENSIFSQMVNLLCIGIFGS